MRKEKIVATILTRSLKDDRIYLFFDIKLYIQQNFCLYTWIERQKKK